MDPIGTVLDEIRRHRRLLVVTHDAADGDAVGSSLAMACLLRALGKEATIVQPGPLPRGLRFLPGSEKIRTFPEGLEGPFDAVVCVDCSTRDRTDPVGTRLPDDLPWINIDHHASNDRFGAANWVDPAYASVGEMVHDLAERAGIVPDRAMTLALYTALVTDTGRFGFSNTRPATHRTAARLLELGVDPSEIHARLFRDATVGLLRLEAEAIARLRTRLGGRIAWTSVTRAMCRRAGCNHEEAPDIVEIPARLAGVEVAVLFRELEPGGGTRVSLRSSRGFAVDRFAGTFGGGGHAAAAGCTLADGLSRAARRVLDALEHAMEEGSR